MARAQPSLAVSCWEQKIFLKTCYHWWWCSDLKGLFWHWSFKVKSSWRCWEMIFSFPSVLISKPQVGGWWCAGVTNGGWRLIWNCKDTKRRHWWRSWSTNVFSFASKFIFICQTNLLTLTLRRSIPVGSTVWQLISVYEVSRLDVCVLEVCFLPICPSTLHTWNTKCDSYFRYWGAVTKQTLKHLGHGKPNLQLYYTGFSEGSE